MTALELRIPPLLVALAVATLMALAAITAEGLSLALPWRLPVAVALSLCGLLIALAGVFAFRRSRTTVNPTTPQASSTVVDSGIYAWSRNPMYLGFLLVLAGWGVFLANLASALLLPWFVAYMNRYQIRPEERVLEAKFGEEYRAYMQRVRRWG